MKKLLAFLLSTALVTTSFASVLPASAKNVDGIVTPDIYNGSMPEELVDIFSFEGATVSDEAGTTYVNSGHNYASCEPISHVSIDNTEAASGKSSMKINLDNTRSWENRNFVKEVASFDSSLLTLKENTEYSIKAKLKATDDFDGQIYVFLLNNTDNPNAQSAIFNKRSATETLLLNNSTDAENYLPWYSASVDAVQKTDSFDLSNWTEIVAANLNPEQVYKAETLSAWLENERPGIAILVQAAAGTVWIDDIDLVPVDEYNGILSRDNLTGKISIDGGFETNMNWIENQFGFKMTDPYKENPNMPIDGYRSYVQDNTNAHTGRYSIKVNSPKELASDADQGIDGRYGIGFNLNLQSEAGKKLLENSNGYYAEAWVKLGDDFNGAIGVKIDNRYVGTLLVDDMSELWMLGNATTKVTAEDVGNGWIKLRTPVITAEKMKNTWGVNTSTLIDLWFTGTGTVWVDDFDFKAVEDNTVTYTPNQQAPHNAFQDITLSTVGDCDIYYTIDGTDPRYSKTAMLYDNTNPLTLDGDIYVLAAALDKETGLFGEVTPTHLFSKTDIFNVTLNASSDVKTAYSKVINMAHASEKDKVEVSFDLTAKGLNGRVAAKMFLAGYGLHKLTVDGDDYTGGWVNTNCEIASVSEDGTVHATAVLDNMDKGYHNLIMVLDGEATAGTAEISNVTVKAEQYAKPVVSVAEIDTPVNNFYTAKDIYTEEISSIEKTIVLTNNTVYYQEGVLSYKVTDTDSNVISEGALEVAIDANDTYEDTIELENITKYGAYKVEYTYTDALNRARKAGKSEFAFIKNNTELASGSSLGISSHMAQANVDADFDFDPIYASYAKAGVKYARIDANWREVEKEKGVYTFPEIYTNVVNAIRKAGMTPVIIINDYGYELYTSDKEVAFANFAEAVVNKFGKGYYECINEPNMSMKAADYAKILKAVYGKISLPGVEVIAGNVSHHGGGYLEEMIKADSTILDCMDVWSVHPYSFNWGSDSSYETTNEYHTYFNELKTNYLDAKNIEIWAGEFGFPVCNTEDGVTDEQSAYYTVRAIAGLNKDGITQNHTLYTEDGSGYNYYQETNFGIFGTENKSTAVAVNNYVNTLSGYKFAEAVSNGNDGVYVYKYTSEDTAYAKYMLWCTNGTKEYSLALPYDRVTALDINGNEFTCDVTETAKNAFAAKTTISEKPIYIQCNETPGNNPLEYKNVINGDFESEELLELVGNSIGATVSLDKNTIWDGMQSYRIDIPENSAGTANFKLKSVDLSQYDANIRYKIRFRLKASAAEMGTVKVQMDSYYDQTKFASYKGDWSWYGEMYTRAVENGQYSLGDQQLKTYWAEYETAPFTIVGNNLDMQFVLSSKGATLWVDNIEIVPAEENSANHGKLYTSFNEETNKLYITAQADAGYELDAVSFIYNNGDCFEKYANAEYSVSSRDNVTTTVFELDAAQYRADAHMLTSSDSRCKYFTATFKRAEVTLAGDATDNGSTDLLDLVRTKKYLAKQTFDIDLVNVDYNADGVVDATDLTSLKKDLIK